MIMSEKYTGQLPKRWKENKIGTIYKERCTKVSDKEFAPLSVTKRGILPQLETVAKTNDNDNRKLVKKNDFVINSRSDRRGSCGISYYDGSVSLINTVLQPVDSGKFSNEYYDWFFHTEQFADEFYKWGYGIVDDLWTTRWLDMKKIYIPLPPIEEQKRIANFLNRKCAQIDEITEELEEKIAKLENLKKQIIYEYVTKGTDRSVKYCDSKVDWVGEIPEHWGLIRIKNVCWLKGRIGWDGLKSDEFTDEGPYLITGTDFLEGKINWRTCVHISERRYNEDRLLHVANGDLLITKDGTVGKLAIVDNCPKKVSLNSGVMIIRPNGRIKYLTKYLFYVLGSNIFEMWYTSTQKGGSTIKHLYQEQFTNFKFCFPPLEEQKGIADFLDNKCAQIDEIAKGTRQQIETLKLFKQSLIYEYVTGKKEVPNHE